MCRRQELRGEMTGPQPQETQKPERRKRARIGAPAMSLKGSRDEQATEVQVYQAIREALMGGALEPGALISSRSIAETLGVSAMPVREALKRLEADGVIDSHAKRGYQVRYLSVEELREILRIRLRLEGMLIREAANRITPGAVLKIRKLETLVAKAADIRTSLGFNYQMHFEAYRWADMPITLGMTENIWLRLGPALYHLGGDYTGATSHDSHSRMIEGLAKGNPDAAEQALHRDLTDAAKVMERRLQEMQKAESRLHP